MATAARGREEGSRQLATNASAARRRERERERRESDTWQREGERGGFVRGGGRSEAEGEEKDGVSRTR